MAYTVTSWINNQPPPLSAANLNRLTDELEAQATSRGVNHSLPTWVDGAAPALTDAAPLNEMERVIQLVATSLGLSYTPTTWQSGWTPSRNATRLNKLEQQATANRIAIDGVQPPLTATVFVSTTGLDSNPGTQAQPWRTLYHAVNSTSTGAVIGMAAGTYTETATCQPASGVSIVGAGATATIIQPASSFSPLVLLQGANHTVSDLSLDGVTKSRSRQALVLTNTTDARLLRLIVKDFAGPATAIADSWKAGGGVHINGGSGAEVANCTITNCANLSAYASGSLAIGSHSGARIHDSTFTGGGQGYAVKGASPSGTLTNCEFYNLTIDVPSSDSYGIGFELESTRASVSSIHHCWFNCELSLTDGNAGTGSATWHIHHNRWVDGIGNPMELSHHNVEIDHNYITGGWPYVIANYRETKVDCSIHHNVFDGAQWVTSILHSDGGAFTNLQVYKNTIRATTQTRDGMLRFASTTSNGSVYDNHFHYVPGGTFSPFGLNLGSFTINHNAYYNVASAGHSNVIAANAASLPGGSFPTAYVPPVGNPAAGVGAFADGIWSDVGVQ